MSSIDTTYGESASGEAIGRDGARELLGPVMGFVAVTVGFTALGAYLGRDLSGVTGLFRTPRCGSIPTPGTASSTNTQNSSETTSGLFSTSEGSTK